MNRKKNLNPEMPPLAPLPQQTVDMSRVLQAFGALILLAYIGMTLAHLVSTPVINSGALIQAPDEAAHISYVAAVAHGHLPLRGDTADHTYEWHQPPLYYAITSLLYSAGPLAMRSMNMIIGFVGLLLILLTVRRLFPREPALAVLAMGFAAFLPMRQAICASVNNDVLIELFFTLTLLLIIEALRGGFSGQRALMLGITVGLALLTKATGFILLPIVLFGLMIMLREGELPSMVWHNTIWLILPIVLFTTPWYIRNIRLYHEITPVKAFAQEFKATVRARDWIGRPVAVDLLTGALHSAPAMNRIGYIALVSSWTWRTFWAAWTPVRLKDIGAPIFLQPSFYALNMLLSLTALIGLIRLHLHRKQLFTSMQRNVIYLCFLCFSLTAISFAVFTWTYFQAQGRYLYPAILPISLLFALGWRNIWPAFYRELACNMVIVLLFILSFIFVAACI